MLSVSSGQTWCLQTLPLLLRGGSESSRQPPLPPSGQKEEVHVNGPGEHWVKSDRRHLEQEVKMSTVSLYHGLEHNVVIQRCITSLTMADIPSVLKAAHRLTVTPH